MKGMLHLWQQVVLIQHTDNRSKLLILIEEDWQESNRFFMTATKFNTSSHTYQYNQPCGLRNEEC